MNRKLLPPLCARIKSAAFEMFEKLPYITIIITCHVVVPDLRTGHQIVRCLSSTIIMRYRSVFSFGANGRANGLQASCIDCLLSLWRSSGGSRSIGSTVGPGEGDDDAIAVTTQVIKYHVVETEVGTEREWAERERRQRELGTERAGDRDRWGR